MGSIVLVTTRIPSLEIALKSNSQKEIENYLLCAPDKVRWQYFLLQETINSGLSIKDFFILNAIAQAESSWRHYDKNGNVLSGLVNKFDKGIFQINTAVHNLSWQTPEDNIRSAIELYKQYGTKPWISSKPKWQRIISMR